MYNLILVIYMHTNNIIHLTDIIFHENHNSACLLFIGGSATGRAPGKLRLQIKPSRELPGSRRVAQSVEMAQWPLMAAPISLIKR